jgi:hypothetical protein
MPLACDTEPTDSLVVLPLPCPLPILTWPLQRTQKFTYLPRKIQHRLVPEAALRSHCARLMPEFYASGTQI